ncbi:subtilisin protease [Melampsora larici-populina 98AG31]|uniref:Subtilisin protease n=1 Tax=Melampsora larici-populina (strain 98AG31 / pathotype 3-4-7) TaxID=747676 RepID=F4RXN0_MELLP|nr:subtilisin protease [Melampsora larici-populina 98AG31]EGG02753.1 subtilisin protease [Melampsora larici-populina 98AG31]
MAPHNHLLQCVYVTLSLFCLLSQPFVCLGVDMNPIEELEYLVKLQDGVSVDSVCEKLKEQDVKHQVTMKMDTNDLVNLFTIKLKSASDAEVLNQNPQVMKVQAVQTMKRADPTMGNTLTTQGVKPTNSAFGPHRQTRVADMHKLGRFGQGIKIAIIDSGVDCSHPALGGGFGPGKKISFGADLVGDNFDGHTVNNPNPTPCTPCGMHGTHTTGIIGADDVGFGFNGVAPNATLGMYLFGCDGSAGTTDALTAKALLQAYKDGAQIISGSLGGIGGWSTGDILSDTVDALAAKGVIVVLAVGNEGNEGVFYTETPAASPSVISTGWVQSSTTVMTTFVASNNKEMSYHSASRINGTNLKVWFNPNIGPEGDACSPPGPESLDLSNVVVLIKRGVCTFITKLQNVRKRGARRVLIYMTDENIVTLEGRLQGIDLGTISNSDGLYIIQQAQQDPNFSLSFPERPHLFAYDAGQVNPASNYGPSFDFKSIQPNFCAVGGNMLSTVPVKDGSYLFSGGNEWIVNGHPTVFYSQMAGIAALVLSTRTEKLNIQQLRALLSTTSQMIVTINSTSILEPAIHQGSGLVNAYCAAYTKTLVSIGSMTLRDLEHFTGRQEFTITNVGTQSYSYTIEHRPAQTLASFAPGTSTPSANPLPIDGHPPANMQTNPQTFQVAPGQTKTIVVQFTPPQGLDQKVLPIYSGYVYLKTDSECERHSIPYYGVYGSMRSQKYINYGPDTEPWTQYKLPRVSNSNRTTPTKPFTFAADDVPWMRYRLDMGTPWSQLDLATSDSILGSRDLAPSSGPEVSLDAYRNIKLIESTFRGVKLLGRLDKSNNTFANRPAATVTFVQPLSGLMNPYTNLTAAVNIPDGSYKILLRVLSIFGDPTKPGDYDAYLSDAFTVARTGAPTTIPA